KRHLRAKVTSYRARGCSKIEAMAEAVSVADQGKGYMTRFFAVCLLLLLGTLGSGLGAPPKSSGLPKIGIISAIGDKFYASKIGMLAFGSDFKEMAIGSWGIDEMMTAKIRTALSPRFDVRPVTYKRAAFAAFPDRSGLVAQNFNPEVVRTQVSPQG